jgi:hypothetical protein
MTARAKSYWNNLLIPGYTITENDYQDLVDTMIVYRPTTEPSISGGILLLDLDNAAQGMFEPRLSSGTRTINTNFTLSTEGVAPTNLISIVFSFTGTITITMPSYIRVSNASSIGTWDGVLRELEIAAGTNDIIEFQLLKVNEEDIWILKVSEAVNV